MVSTKPDKKKVAEPFKVHLAFPTRNSTMDIGTVSNVISALSVIAEKKNIIVQDCVVQASNIPRARNACMENFGRETVASQKFIIWIDDDIVIRDGNKFLESLVYALSLPREAILVVGYRMNIAPDFENTVRQYRRIRGEGPNPPYVVSEDEAVTCLGLNGCAGLGLAMGWFPDDYIFHADEVGEDVYFWCENPEIKMYVDNRWMAGHRKEMIL